MADELKDNETEDFVIVEEVPVAPTGDDDGDQGKGKEPEADAGAEDDEDDDEGDTRLAQSEDDSDDDIANQTNAKRRKERRERQKRAREAQEAELRLLRETVAQMNARLAQQENHTLTIAEQDIVRQYHAKVQEAQQAERIMAAAINAGNGEDSVAASRIRDQAAAEAQRLRSEYAELQQQKQQSSVPAAKPSVQTHAQEWMAANSWYDPNGGDEDSAIVNAIDLTLTREGYDPSTRGYWEELTRRASTRLGAGSAAATEDKGGGDVPPRRKAPPQGLKREHVPASTKTEIYVSPERKAAMIEAGKWDDPVERNRLLKAYAEHDRNAANR